MKKLLFLAVLPLLYCNLPAQNVNDNDFLILQKSNALLKIQLNEQKQTMLEQIIKTDSIISMLQSATGEIKKNADNQTSITQSIADLNEKTTNISQAFIDRRLYAIIAIIGFAIIILIFLFYMKRKFSAIKSDINQSEMNFIIKISQTNDYIKNEISEIKVQLEKQSKEFNLIIEKQSKEFDQAIEKQVKEIYRAIEKQTSENNNKLTKLSTDTAESIINLSDGFNKTIESQVSSVKGIFHEQLSQTANEFNGKIAELNKTVEKKIAAIKNDLTANINEINEKFKNIPPNSKKEN
jgi:hypothetical protein